MHHEHAMFDMVSSLACGREIPRMTAWVAKEVVRIPAVSTLLTGATSGHSAHLVNNSRCFYLHIFDDEMYWKRFR